MTIVAPHEPASDRCAKCRAWFRPEHRPPPGEFRLCDRCIEAKEPESQVAGADWFLVDPTRPYRSATTISLDGGFREAIQVYKKRKDLTLIGIAECGCAASHSVADAWQITDACRRHNRIWIVTIPASRSKDVQLAGPVDQVALDALIGVDYDDALATYRRWAKSAAATLTGLRSLAWCGCITDRAVTSRRSDEHGNVDEVEHWRLVKRCGAPDRIGTSDHDPLPHVRRL